LGIRASGGKSVSELEALQKWMGAALRRRRALPGAPDVEREAALRIRGNERLSPAAQLEIYREQFWLRHTASLLEDFPGLSGILGQKDWERLVEGYLEDTIPTSWTLRDLGSKLPSYVERAAWLPHHALSIDMARFEWAHVEVFDAADATPLDAQRLARILPEAWETATIVLAPALALLEVRYPVARLRSDLRAGAPALPPPDPSPGFLVIHRDEGLNLCCRELERSAFELLLALRAGEPLVVACESARARVPVDATAFESKLAGWFRTFGTLGWVVDVQTPR